MFIESKLWFFQSCKDVELDYKEGRELKNWYFWNVMLEKTIESSLDSKEIKPVNPKRNQSWNSIENVGAGPKALIVGTWYKKQTHWKRSWCWERLKAGAEEGYRGWDGWMASLIQRTWVLANSIRQWSTGKPGVL